MSSHTVISEGLAGVNGVSQRSQAIILEAEGVISWVSERHAGDRGMTQGAFGVNVSHRDQCGWVSRQ